MLPMTKTYAAGSPRCGRGGQSAEPVPEEPGALGHAATDDVVRRLFSLTSAAACQSNSTFSTKVSS